MIENPTPEVEVTEEVNKPEEEFELGTPSGDANHNVCESCQ